MSTKIIFAILTVVFFTIAVAGGCDDGCKTESFRCSGSDLEICSSAGTWMFHTACADVYSPTTTASYACCYADDGGTEPECLPPDECE